MLARAHLVELIDGRLVGWAQHLWSLIPTTLLVLDRHVLTDAARVIGARLRVVLRRVPREEDPSGHLIGLLVTSQQKYNGNTMRGRKD